MTRKNGIIEYQKARKNLPTLIGKMMEEDERVVLLLAGLGGWTFRNLPRVYDIGIAEQTMIGVGAGLAMGGKLPVMLTIDSFLVRRAYEQIRLDFVHQDLPGLFIGLHGYEKLGKTHDCDECFALMRSMMEAVAIRSVRNLEEEFNWWLMEPELLYLEVPA